MPYMLHGAGGRFTRRSHTNPLVGRSGRPLHGAALARARASVAAGRYPRGVRYVPESTAMIVGRPKSKKRGSLSKRARKVRRLRAAASKTTRKSTKRRTAAKKGSKSMSKSTKRSRGAKKAAATRKRKHLARVRAGKKAARSRKGLSKRSRRTARSLRRPRIKKLKIRATIARVRRKGQRKGRLVLLVPKSKKRSIRGKRWAKHRILYNPMGGSGGIMATLKGVFTVETVKVVGGGLAGFTLAAAAGEAAARKLVKDPVHSKAAFVGVGLGVGVVVSVTGGVLIGKKFPTFGRAFLWGGLLGTVIRALAATFPGKGFDMPKTASEADMLAVKLHAAEGASSSGAPSNPQQLANQMAATGVPTQAILAATGLLPQGATDYAQVRDYLPAVNDYLSLSGGGTGSMHAGHPMVGAGQHW